MGAVDGIGPVIKLDGETGVSFCGNGEVEVHRGGVPGEVGGDGFAASGEVFIGRDFDGGGVGRNIGVGDAQDGGLMRQVCLEVVATVFDQGACPTVTEVSSLGGGVFRGVGEAESVTAFVVVVGNIGIGNLGTVFDGAAAGEFCREGAGVFAGFAFKSEAIVFVIDHYANLVSVLPGEGGGAGTGVVDEGLGGGLCQADVDGDFFGGGFRSLRGGWSLREVFGRASGKCDGEKGIDCFIHNAAVLEDPVAPGVGIAFEGIRDGVFACDRTDKEGLFCADLNHC